MHYFPAYAPELNPAEYVWVQADHEIANGAPDDLRELRQRLTDATTAPLADLLWSCIYASDLPWGRLRAYASAVLTLPVGRARVRPPTSRGGAESTAVSSHRLEGSG